MTARRVFFGYCPIVVPDLNDANHGEAVLDNSRGVPQVNIRETDIPKERGYALAELLEDAIIGMNSKDGEVEK